MNILVAITCALVVLGCLYGLAVPPAVYRALRPLRLRRALLDRLIEEGWRPGLAIAYLWMDHHMRREYRYAAPWGRQLWSAYERKAWSDFESEIGPAKMAVLCEGLSRWKSDPLNPAMSEWFWGRLGEWGVRELP